MRFKEYIFRIIIIQFLFVSLVFSQDMRETLSGELGVPVEVVNVKAKTSEHVGSVGREECIVATVSVLLKKV